MKHIYIILPVHNRKETTLDCLRLLQRQTYRHFQTLLVDDGSDDGTEEAVRKEFPHVIILKGTGNWWWTKSVNEGCKHALSLGADSVLLLNDDTYFEPDFLQQFIESIQAHPNAIIGAISITKEEPNRIFFSGIKRMDWLKSKAIKYHQQFELYSSDSIHGVHKSLTLPGRGVYIPASSFAKIGYFNEKHMPQYFADFDFTQRANRAGIKVLINWDLIIYSYWQQTGKGALYIKQNILSFLKAFFNTHSHRSILGVYFYFKSNCPTYLLPSALIIHHLRVFYSYFAKSKTL